MKDECVDLLSKVLREAALLPKGKKPKPIYAIQKQCLTKMKL